MIFEFLLPILLWLMLFGVCFLVYTKMFYVEKHAQQHVEGQSLYSVLSAFFWIILYFSLSSIWSIFYSLIDLKYPDLIGAANDYSYGLSSVGQVYDTFAFPLAMIVVSSLTSLLLAFFLMRKLQQNKNIRSERLYTFIRLLVYIGGAIMVFFGFVYVVYSWLYGNLPVAVFLKALVALVIVGSVALYFYLVENNKNKEAQISKIFALLLVLVTIITLYFSFSIVGTPADARKFRLDSITLQNLQTVKSEIDNQHQNFGVTIKNLDEITADYVRSAVKKSPMNYTVTEENYTLCAEFNSDMPQSINMENRDETWDYKAGETCFTFKHQPTYPNVNGNNAPLPKAIYNQ